MRHVEIVHRLPTEHENYSGQKRRIFSKSYLSGKKISEIYRQKNLYQKKEIPCPFLRKEKDKVIEREENSQVKSGQNGITCAHIWIPERYAMLGLYDFPDIFNKRSILPTRGSNIESRKKWRPHPLISVRP